MMGKRESMNETEKMKEKRREKKRREEMGRDDKRQERGKEKWMKEKEREEKRILPKYIKITNKKQTNCEQQMAKTTKSSTDLKYHFGRFWVLFGSVYLS